MKNKLLYLVSGFVALIIGTFPGNYSWVAQFFLTSLVFFLAGLYIGYKGNKQMLLFVVLPYTLFGALFIVYNKLSIHYLQVISVYAFYFIGQRIGSRLTNRQMILPSILSVLVIGLLAYYIFPNWLSYSVQQEKKLSNLTLNQFRIVDSVGNTMDDSLKNKFILLDFWTTSCGICFEKFPHLDAIVDKYKHRKDFSAYAFHIPCSTDTGSVLEKAIMKHIRNQGYSFPVAYSLDSANAMAKKGIETYPTVALFDKSGHLIYGGYLETESKLNNIHDIIENALLGKK